MGHMPLAKRAPIALICSGVVTSFALQIYAYYVRDLRLRETQPVYQSSAYVSSLFIDCMLCIEAWRSTTETFKHEVNDEVLVLRTVVNCANVVHFASFPVICLCMVACSPWRRAAYIVYA